MYLFSKHYGVVHAIAKGLRKQKAPQNFLERGFLIELLLYMRPNRDLHTAGSIQVVNFFLDTRKDLIKSAIRDTIFEATLLFLTQADPHPDLFMFLHTVLEAVESNHIRRIHPVTLWHFFHKSSALLGFELNLSTCLQCGLPPVTSVRLDSPRGGFICEKCSPNCPENQRFPMEAIRTLRNESLSDSSLAETLDRTERKRITFLLADFCRLHFDIGYEFKSLAFLNSMTER